MTSTIWQARVLSATGRYADRGPLLSNRIMSIGDDHTVAITIGEIPVQVREAVAHLPGVLDHFFNPNAAVAPEDLPAELTDPKVVYTTLIVSRDVEIDELPKARESGYFWYSQASADAALTSFLPKARSILDGLTGRLAVSLGCELIGSVVYESRCFVTHPLKPVQPLTQLRLGNAEVFNVGPAEALHADRLLTLAEETTDTLQKFENVGRWLAAASGETDPFKRFMWAYAGLEVLAGKTAKALRDEVITCLATIPAANAQAEDGAVTGLTRASIEQLLYPAPTDESRDPGRNIMFRFANMAIAVEGASEAADHDINEFRRVNSFRNRIHGLPIDEELAASEARAALTLLRKYLPVVGRRIAS